MTSMATSTGEAGRFEQFVGLFKHWLLNLEVNSQLFVEIMKDSELPLAARTLAAGVLIYVVSPIDLIPEKVKALKLIALVDDVVVMIVGLGVIVPLMPEESLEHYRQGYEAVAQISDYEETLKATLGILWDRLVQFVEKLRQRSLDKQTTEEIVESPELSEELFDETMVYVANLNLDPAALDEQVKSLPAPEQVLGLLASGVEEEMQPEKPSLVSRSRSALRQMLPGGEKEQTPENLLEEGESPKTQDNPRSI